MPEIRVTCEELRSRANDVERSSASFADQKDRKAALKEAEELRKAAADRECL